MQTLNGVSHVVELQHDLAGDRVGRSTSLGHREQVTRDPAGNRRLTVLDGREIAREWLPKCKLAHFQAYSPVRADCLEAVSPEPVRFLQLSTCKGAPLALPRFVDVTDLHIKQVRTLKNLDLVRPLQKIEELSLHYQASWENLDGLDDLPALRMVELESCSDRNGALRIAVERLRARGVLVRSTFTKSAGTALEVSDF